MKINVLPSSLDYMIEPALTIDLLGLKQKKNKALVIEFLKCADLDVDDIDLLEIDNPSFNHLNGIKGEIPEKVKIIRMGHKVAGTNEMQYFDFGVESAGTRKLFCIL